MEEHRIASGGGKAMGALGGEDADLFVKSLKTCRPTAKYPAMELPMTVSRFEHGRRGSCAGERGPVVSQQKRVRPFLLFSRLHFLHRIWRSGQ
jgi:hypothetical protein